MVRKRSSMFYEDIARAQIELTTHRSSFRTKHNDFPNMVPCKLHNDAYFHLLVVLDSIAANSGCAYISKCICTEKRVGRTQIRQVRGRLHSKEIRQSLFKSLLFFPRNGVCIYRRLAEAVVFSLMHGGSVCMLKHIFC